MIKERFFVKWFLFLCLVIAIFIIMQYKFLIVLTGSMTPTFDKGSIVVVKQVDPKLLKKGDIITFRGPHNSNILITHRIFQVYKREVSRVFKTRGDANINTDNNLVESGTILGQVKFAIPYLGYFFQFIKSPFGFICFIIFFGIIIPFR